MARIVGLDNEHLHVTFRKIERGSYLGGSLHIYFKVYSHESGRTVGRGRNPCENKGKTECLAPPLLSSSSLEIKQLGKFPRVSSPYLFLPFQNVFCLTTDAQVKGNLVYKRACHQEMQLKR